MAPKELISDLSLTFLYHLRDLESWIIHFSIPSTQILSFPYSQFLLLHHARFQHTDKTLAAFPAWLHGYIPCKDAHNSTKCCEGESERNTAKHDVSVEQCKALSNEELLACSFHAWIPSDHTAETALLACSSNEAPESFKWEFHISFDCNRLRARDIG